MPATTWNGSGSRCDGLEPRKFVTKYRGGFCFVRKAEIGAATTRKMKTLQGNVDTVEPARLTVEMSIHTLGSMIGRRVVGMPLAAGVVRLEKE